MRKLLAALVCLLGMSVLGACGQPKEPDAIMGIWEFTSNDCFVDGETDVITPQDLLDADIAIPTLTVDAKYSTFTLMDNKIEVIWMSKEEKNGQYVYECMPGEYTLYMTPGDDNTCKLVVVDGNDTYTYNFKRAQ